MGQAVAKPLSRRNRQFIRLGAIDGDNEGEILWEPKTGKVALRYYNEKKGTEVMIGKSFKMLEAPSVGEAVKKLDKLAEKGMDGKLVAMLKEMVGKMSGLLPPAKEDKQQS